MESATPATRHITIANRVLAFHMDSGGISDGELGRVACDDDDVAAASEEEDTRDAFKGVDSSDEESMRGGTCLFRSKFSKAIVDGR